MVGVKRCVTFGEPRLRGQGNNASYRVKVNCWNERVVSRNVRLWCNDMCHPAMTSLANLHSAMDSVVMMVTAFVVLLALLAAVVTDVRVARHYGKIACHNHSHNMYKNP